MSEYGELLSSPSKMLQVNQTKQSINRHFVIYFLSETHSSEPLKPTEKLIPNGENIFFFDFHKEKTFQILI